MKEKPAPTNENEQHNQQVNSNTFTTKSGRRGASSLWFAIRTLHRRQLSQDDVRILSEALDDLQIIVGRVRP